MLILAVRGLGSLAFPKPLYGVVGGVDLCRCAFGTESLLRVGETIGWKR